MKQSVFRVLSPQLLVFTLLLIVIFGMGCDGGGGGGDDTGNGSDTRFSIPLGVFVDEVAVESSQPTQFKFTYPRRVGAQPFTDLSIDFTDTLQAVMVDIPGPSANLRKNHGQSLIQPQQETSATMTARVASADEEETVCKTGELYGPYVIYGSAAYEPESVDPQSAQATQATLSIINAGDFSICIEISSPVDATLSVNSMDVDVGSCETPPADISGTWVGTYSCDNTGTSLDCSDDGGDILLTITQNGYSARYEDDGGAVYNGTVCGNTFKYNGGEASYDEEGTFTLNADGTASKTSRWVSNIGDCGGVCEDILQRQ